MSARFVAAGLVSVLAIATLAAVPFGADASAEPRRYVVGFAPGDAQAAAFAVDAAGGEWVRGSDAAGFALVDVPAAHADRLGADPRLTFAYADAAVARPAGADWDGADWDGADWDGADWDGADWDGADWDGADWDTVMAQGADWDGADWDGADWDGADWDGADWDGLDGPDTGLPAQWALSRIGAAEAWAHTTGTRTANLCVVDSGVDATHPDIAANLWRDPVTGAIGWNAIDGSTDVTDGAGHGTHVAGIAGGVTGNAWGTAGVGNVRLMIVKALTDEGTGTEGDVAMGLTWCADNGADVILLALSTDHMGHGLNRAIRYAADADALIVSSAGNEGPCESCVRNPARSPLVLGVGATTLADAPAPFSSRGPAVTLAAPGVAVLGPVTDGGFAFSSGTSHSAALVAGTAALVRDANPSLTAEDVRDLLLDSAEDLGEPGWDRDYGHGLVDAGAAIRAALEVQ